MFTNGVVLLNFIQQTINYSLLCNKLSCNFFFLCRSRSASLGQIVDISAPMDFRHIQHGFSPSELTPTNSTPIVQSPTITDNSNPGSNNTLTPS